MAKKATTKKKEGVKLAKSSKGGRSGVKGGTGGGKAGQGGANSD